MLPARGHRCTRSVRSDAYCKQPQSRIIEGGMTTECCPLALRLLDAVRDAQAALIAHADAGDAAQAGLCGLCATFASGLDGLSEEQILHTPSPDEWSIAEVLEHVAEHDGKFEELERLGFDHYIEHGLEHALQLWRLRAGVRQPAGSAIPARSDH